MPIVSASPSNAFGLNANRLSAPAVRLAVYSLKDSPLRTPSSNHLGRVLRPAFFGAEIVSAHDHFVERRLDAWPFAVLHLQFVEQMRQIGRAAERVPFAALADHQHPCGVDSWDQLLGRGGDVGQHFLDVARRRGGAGQLGHPHCEIVVPRFVHDRRVPIRPRAHTAGDEGATEPPDQRLSSGDAWQCCEVGECGGRPLHTPRSRRFRPGAGGADPPSASPNPFSHSVSCSIVRSWAAPPTSGSSAATRATSAAT